jgi:hypothetical protein
MRTANVIGLAFPGFLSSMIPMTHQAGQLRATI